MRYADPVAQAEIDYLASCPECPVWFWSETGIVPRHTRSVWGIGWGGRPMHLPCPGAGRHQWVPSS